MRKLTPKQRLFIKEYLVYKNATQAAINAGYSKNCAKEIGHENLTKPHISLLIDEGLRKLEEKVDITNERILKEWELLAFSDVASLFKIDEGGQVVMKTLDEIPEGLTRVIESIGEDRVIKENPDGSQITVYDKFKYKLHSKVRALEALTRINSMYPDQKLKLGLEGIVNGKPVEFNVNFINTNGEKPED